MCDQWGVGRLPYLRGDQVQAPAPLCRLGGEGGGGGVDQTMDVNFLKPTQPHGKFVTQSQTHRHL